jgi:TonB-linked SusC/RagA family outer membrane protein
MRPIRVALLATLLTLSGVSAQTTGGAIARNVDLMAATARSPNPLDMAARLRIENVSLPDGLTRLQEKSGVSLAFSPSLLSETRRVTCLCEELTVREALDRILAGAPLGYVELGGHVVIERRRRIMPPGIQFAAMEPAAIEMLSDLGTAGFFAPIAGVIVGRVIDASSREPIADAQVSVVGTTISAQTNAAGRYRLEAVPAGPARVSAARIGFGNVTVAVEVTDGETTTVDLQMRETALALEAIVVTGTPGEARLRSLGNVVGQIDAEGIAEVNATPRVQDLLGGAEPGVDVFFVGGGVNPGAHIRIRGASSIALRSDPLIFIDGVRANSGLATGPAAGFGNPPSRLSDIDPEEIKSIEVVKGPAAATLYGTEASNGVINIITKRGRAGPPRFSVSMQQGINQMPGGMENAYNPTYYRCQGFAGSGCTPGEIVEVNVLREERERYGNVWFGNGHTQMYNASVSGGSESVNYYFSGTYNNGRGISADDWKKQWNARANFDWTPSDKIGLQLGIGTISSEARTPSANQPITLGVFLACPAPGCEPGSGLGGALDGAFRGYFAYTPDGLINHVFGIQDVNRQTINLTITQKPFSWLSGRFVVGTDLTREQSTLLRTPLAPGQVGHTVPQGGKSGTNTSQDVFTLDYALTATAEPFADIALSTSAGFQYYTFTDHSFNASGSQFAVSTLETVNAGAVRSSSESYSENKTAGVFVQQSVSWDDRLFLTGAIRFDDNSAFGQNFELVSYPKVSVSWVASEGQHFDWLSQLRLRSAWGKAGQQPSTFAAVRTYSPVIGPGGTATISRQNIGNPDLEPEIGAEWETGFDASFREDRYSVKLTYYNQARDKAIISVPVKPSLGFGGTQFRNLGRIRNTGLELGLEGKVYESTDVAVDFGLSFWKNSNKVESLGGLPPQPLDDNNAGTGWGRQRYAEGFPLGAIFLKRVVSADIVGTGEDAVAVNVMCEGGAVIPGTDVLSRGGGAPVPCDQAPEIYMGTPVPSTTSSGNVTLTLFNRLELYGQVDYQGGSTVIDGQIGLPHLFAHNSRAILERTDPILLGYESLGVDGMNQAGIIDASFARLRRAAATYHLPESLSQRVGAERASITLAARNVAWLWQKETEVFGHRVVDHEQRKVHAGAETALQAFRQEGWPTLRELSLAVRFSF